MRHQWRPRLFVLALFAVLVLNTPALEAATQAQGSIAEEDFTVTLGDGWVSQAKLTYPAGQAGPFPTLLLVYPGDMDFTIPGDAGIGPGVRYFKDLAETLAARGIATVRHHARYVTGPDDTNNERTQTLTLPDFVADAELVLATLRANPRVDQNRIFIYGWSFSSSLVTDVASRHPDLAGVIIQGATASTETQVFIEDYLDNTLPYLIQFAPDGRITADVLRQAQDGNGTFAKFSAFDFHDPASPDAIRVTPVLDSNGDGVLDVGTEIIPNLAKLVAADPSGFVRNISALPSVSEQASGVRIPVLVLQGEADTAVRVRNVRGLDQAFATNPDYTLQVYPGLGHALYPVPSRFEDLFGPMDPQPKADLAAWVLARGVPAATPAQPVALPNTGGPELPVAWLAAAAVAFLATGAALRRRGARRTN